MKGFRFDSPRREKNRRTKERIRRDVEDAIARFLADGGKITICKPCLSGRLEHYDEDLTRWRWGRGKVAPDAA